MNQRVGCAGHTVLCVRPSASLFGQVIHIPKFRVFFKKITILRKLINKCTDFRKDFTTKHQVPYLTRQRTSLNTREADTIGLIGKLVGAALMPVVLGAAVLGAGPMLVVGAPAALAAAALMDDD